MKTPPLKYAGFDPVLPLETLDAPDEVVEIYQQKQHELDLTKDMFAAVGSDKFTRRAIEIFGAPTAEDAGESPRSTYEVRPCYLLWKKAAPQENLPKY